MFSSVLQFFLGFFFFSLISLRLSQALSLILFSHVFECEKEEDIESDQQILESMRLQFLKPADEDDETAETAAVQMEEFVEKVLEKAEVADYSGDAVASFPEMPCLTPRGRYDIDVSKQRKKKWWRERVGMGGGVQEPEV